MITQFSLTNADEHEPSYLCYLLQDNAEADKADKIKLALEKLKEAKVKKVKQANPDVLFCPVI